MTRNQLVSAIYRDGKWFPREPPWDAAQRTADWLIARADEISRLARPTEAPASAEGSPEAAQVQGAWSRDEKAQGEDMSESIEGLVERLNRAGRLEAETGVNHDIVDEDGSVILTANDLCLAAQALLSLQAGWRPDREQVAKVIDPIAAEFHDRPTVSKSLNAVNRDAWAHALSKADAILALPLLAVGGGCSSGGRVQAAPDGATGGQHSAGERDIRRLWARDLTDEELAAERARLDREWDELTAALDESGGAAGSPLEGLDERLGEIEHEIAKRRELQTWSHKLDEPPSTGETSSQSEGG
jgi:hypothetical protein